ncbi:MAG TPA: entericidin A/B family lipoprotein [Solimonas sp.]|nr:entericidin A/B family lipoprotein [Solimonas sp.]
MTLWMRDLVIAALLGSCAALTACNTIEGAGKDVERGGEAVQDAAKPDRK